MEIGAICKSQAISAAERGRLCFKIWQPRQRAWRLSNSSRPPFQSGWIWSIDFKPRTGTPLDAAPAVALKHRQGVYASMLLWTCGSYDHRPQRRAPVRPLGAPYASRGSRPGSQPPQHRRGSGNDGHLPASRCPLRRSPSERFAIAEDSNSERVGVSSSRNGRRTYYRMVV